MKLLKESQQALVDSVKALTQTVTEDQNQMIELRRQKIAAIIEQTKARLMSNVAGLQTQVDTTLHRISNPAQPPIGSTRQTGQHVVRQYDHSHYNYSHKPTR